VEPAYFVSRTIDAFESGDAVMAASDQTVSPTYVPDLVYTRFDLLID
jgi:dTDP-4-dehydrorhamnose reductase